MSRYFVLYVALFLCFCGFSTCKTSTQPTTSIPLEAVANNDVNLQRIAVGSCARQDLPQKIWLDIAAAKPDLWIWLGDNIYGTPKATVEKLANQYKLQKNNPDYQHFVKTGVPIIGLWDDNDYGLSDGGKNLSFKKESQALMMDFLDLPPDAPQRKHEGIYASYLYGKSKQKVKVILLDTRYFRDNLIKDTIAKKYIPNENGDMLGEEQWAWFENELKHNKAQVNIIASGIQVLSSEHPYEKWANLPKSRKRLLDLIQKYKPENTILITGDRHVGEIARISLPQYRNLYEITSSGITHIGTIKNEPNIFRIGETVNELHYAVIDINWQKKPLEVYMKIIGEGNKVLATRKL